LLDVRIIGQWAAITEAKAFFHRSRLVEHERVPRGKTFRQPSAAILP
jgi:hypothetical protein